MNSGADVQEWLNSILRRIAEGSLLPDCYFAGLDCDAVLNSRNEDKDFDAKWIRLFKDIERRLAGATVADQVRALVEDIRRESFLVVSQATKQHEIASYVSDDFDLVVRGRLLGLTDPFLDHLWLTYENGKFPHPLR